MPNPVRGSLSGSLWPVPGMIAQHHEHLSGSGCPSRPQREEICLGAGIIAVTDTVKAMSYRAALGAKLLSVRP